jgi:hypothetical protein
MGHHRVVICGPGQQLVDVTGKLPLMPDEPNLAPDFSRLTEEI